MCGLAGIFDTQGRREIAESVLDRMNGSQIHRGPDEGGVYREPGVGLAHRRLSIIDLANGQQPLFNEDRSVVVVYNGEVYNFQELARELTGLGHAFRTYCDTEVIVHAWESWGEACVQRFRGMFAFALWDRRRETLFLARDRFGVKPLHYALLPDGQVAFASELKALLMVPGLRKELDPHAVEDYLAYGYVPQPRTIFRDTFKLAAGHTLTLKRGRPLAAPAQYWDIRFTPTAPITEQQAGDELIERLREAVRIRLVAEVPLGAFLSGGVDSSAVVALMAGESKDPVNTCSISFADAAFDESAHAARVADRYKTLHHVERVHTDDFGLLDRLAELYDEPFADSSAIPTYRVSQLARKHVTVALSGDGGDEHLAGYRRYRLYMGEERLRSLAGLGIRRPLFGLLGRVYPKLDWAPRVVRAKTTFEALARDSVAGYFHDVSIVTDRTRRMLFSDRFCRDLQGYSAVEVLRHHAAHAPTDQLLSLIQYLDLKTYLVDDILTKVDRASMAHSLEVRAPMLDHKLAEWIAGLPPDFKLRRGTGKYMLKTALEGYLPRDILYRPKQGFAVPISAWLRGPLRTRTRAALLGPVLADSGIFDRRSILHLIEQHETGRRDNGAALWTLLMFEAFYRRVQGVGVAEAPSGAAA